MAVDVSSIKDNFVPDLLRRCKRVTSLESRSIDPAIAENYIILDDEQHTEYVVDYLMSVMVDVIGWLGLSTYDHEKPLKRLREVITNKEADITLFDLMGAEFRQNYTTIEELIIDALVYGIVMRWYKETGMDKLYSKYFAIYEQQGLKIRNRPSRFAQHQGTTRRSSSL